MSQRMSAAWISEKISPIVGTEEAQLAISILKGIRLELNDNNFFSTMLPSQTCIAFALLYAAVFESLRLYATGIDERDPTASDHAKKKMEQLEAVRAALCAPTDDGDSSIDDLLGVM